VLAKDATGNTRTNTYDIAVGSGTISYTYNARGDLVQRAVGSDAWTYDWDARSLLRRVTRNGAEVARFEYDPLGRRLEKVAGGATANYVYDGVDIVRETVSGGSTTTYGYIHGPGIDEPLARENVATGTLTYFHADGLGSIVKVTDTNGSVVLTRQYDAWGNLETGAADPGYAYTGREWDPETGLYYYRARYYDPKIGRFISEDPIGFLGGVNLYAYVDNRPTEMIDPLGWAGIMVDPNTPMGQRMANMSAIERLLMPLDFIMPLSVVGKAETLARLGTSYESAARLARKAAEAERAIGVHGVSCTAAKVEGAQGSTAAREIVEQQFRVLDTPTRADPLHRTVELPNPVTKAIADAFNALFGR